MTKCIKSVKVISLNLQNLIKTVWTHLLLAVGDIPDPAPGERLVWVQFVVGVVDVETLSVHTQ